MLGHLFTKALRLNLDGRIVCFSAVGDFEFALASRTEVPAAKVAELMRLGADALRDEATRIRQVERHFIDVLARSIEENGATGLLLRELDPKLFSQDHGWRLILCALARQSRDFDAFKKIALIKYVQYLASRQDVLKSIYASKGERADGGAAEPPEPGRPSEGALRETVIFDLSQRAEDGGGSTRLQRLPVGESVALRLPPDGEIDLVLSRHRFKLVTGERLYLVDEGGADYRLRQGHNTVGRQPQCDVVINPAYRDISRKHLLIDVPGGNTVLVTDLSSHGTFVMPAAPGAAVLR